jgi:hypothetical protein
MTGRPPIRITGDAGLEPVCLGRPALPYERSSVADLPTGSKEPKSTVLSIEDEAIIVAFRRHTVL